MVYYLTFFSCAYISIVGASRMTRRSASARVRLHHPRRQHGREDARKEKKMEWLLEPGRTSGPPPGHPGNSRIIWMPSLIIRLRRPNTPEESSRSQTIRGTTRIIRATAIEDTRRPHVKSDHPKLHTDHPKDAQIVRAVTRIVRSLLVCMTGLGPCIPT